MKLQTITNELPSEYADRIGLAYANTVTLAHKKENGQFFTPIEIARFMSELSCSNQEELRILDPGCGTSILSISLIETLTQKETLRKVFLDVYETDTDILQFTKEALNYLKDWLSGRGVVLVFDVIPSDFILYNKSCFEQTLLFNEKPTTKYDIVISNPPYFKLSKDDIRAKVAATVNWGQPNIYSIFMLIAAKLLNPSGEFIFIIPRSFASGNYFRTFREEFFKEVQIQRIHLFASRTDAFNRDNVLQETLIIKGIRDEFNSSTTILLSNSNGAADIMVPKMKEYRADKLIKFDSREKILHLPINDIDDKVIQLFKSWSGSLHKYDIQISTGPVVSFRATKYLHESYSNGSINLVPLYQLVNTSKMRFEWPVTKKNKPQFIELCDDSKSLLLPNKNYIFLRRFSSKDDKSRLVASPYFINTSDAEFIGVENHLNYIYRSKGNLEKNEIVGLSVLLNSSLFDTYFRTFNGNINVSATELREMPMPPLDDIKKIGREFITKGEFCQTHVDTIISKHFNLEYIFESYEQN